MIDGESGEKTFRTLVKSQDEVIIKSGLFLNKSIHVINNSGSLFFFFIKAIFVYKSGVSLVNKKF